MFNNFFPENCAVYEIIGKNMVEPHRPQITYTHTQRTHADSLSLSLGMFNPSCLSTQQSFRERATVLCYTYVACLV